MRAVLTAAWVSAEVNDRFLGAGFVPQKTNSRDFCAGLPRRRERPRHRTAEHTEKCASLHVQPQAQEKASRRNDKNEHFGSGLQRTSDTVHLAPLPLPQ